VPAAAAGTPSSKTSAPAETTANSPSVVTNFVGGEFLLPS
jgi:hypothetical protein